MMRGNLLQLQKITNIGFHIARKLMQRKRIQTAGTTGNFLTVVGLIEKDL